MSGSERSAPDVASQTSGVVFFDPVGTLLETGTPRLLLRAEFDQWLTLARHHRLGVLGTLPGRATSRDLLLELEAAGIDGYFEDELIVSDGALPVHLPDHRVFAVAAALAGAPVQECVFVSANPVRLAAAAAAGMRVVLADISPPVRPPAEPRRARRPGAPESGIADLASSTPEAPVATPTVPVLLAGEVDEDRGPTFVLRGRVVTMNASGEVLNDGLVGVRRGRIEVVMAAGQQLPAEFQNAPEIDVGGTIFPGLIDLHNHFVYNVLPLWPVDMKYGNRDQWPRKKRYKEEVSLPVKTLAAYADTSRALIRYVEAKALVGGTTTGQGILTQVQGTKKIFHGAMRNVEDTEDERLPEAGTLVPNLQATNPAKVEAFRRALKKRGSKGGAYFYHLAEGVDESAHRRYQDLADNDLIAPALVGIHALGLAAADYRTLAQAGAKVVWSPFSNLLLYGKTIDLATLKESGVRFSIGCDWSPTGSKNLLEELKVARWESKRQGQPLSDEDLVRAATVHPAQVLGWQRTLGVLQAGMLADLVVIGGMTGNAYGSLVDATEMDVRLVIVHGQARYGDRPLMRQLHTGAFGDLETWKLDGQEKAFHLRAASSGLDDLTFAKARAVLQDAMSDLRGFAERMEQIAADLSALGMEEAQPFSVILDNEYEPAEEELEAELLAGEVQVTPRVELDEPYVNTDSYWERLDQQTNITAALAPLRQELRNAYRVQ